MSELDWRPPEDGIANSKLEEGITELFEYLRQADDEAATELAGGERHILNVFHEWEDVYGRREAHRMLADAIEEVIDDGPAPGTPGHEFATVLAKAIKSHAEIPHFEPKEFIRFAEWAAQHADDLKRDSDAVEEQAAIVESTRDVTRKVFSGGPRIPRKPDSVADLEYDLTEFLVNYAVDHDLYHFDRFEEVSDWFDEFREQTGGDPNRSVSDHVRESEVWPELRLGPGDLDRLRAAPETKRLDEVPLHAFLVGLRRLQHVVRDASYSLTVPKSWAWDHFQTALNLIPPQKLRAQRAMDLLVEDNNGLEGRVDRSIEITRLAVRAQLPEESTRYLRLLARSYVAGFFSECLIVCRSILEQSVDSCFIRHDREDLLNRYSSMHQKLKGARLQGWLNEDEVLAAQRIWLKGNRIIHEDPQVRSQEAIITISETLDLTEELAHAGTS